MRPARLLRRSRFRSASRRSPARSGLPRAAGSRRSTPASPTSTRSTAADTSPRGSSRSSSPPRCARRSSRCVKRIETSYARSCSGINTIADQGRTACLRVPAHETQRPRQFSSSQRCRPAPPEVGRSGSGRRDPPLSGRCRGRAPHRSSPADRGDTVARPGDGQGPVAGHTAGEAAGARPLLGLGLRLAQSRSEAERASAVHDRDRRARHPSSPRPLSSSERPAR